VLASGFAQHGTYRQIRIVECNAMLADISPGPGYSTAHCHGIERRLGRPIGGASEEVIPDVYGNAGRRRILRAGAIIAAGAERN
jgi:hypothetical protein